MYPTVFICSLEFRYILESIIHPTPPPILIQVGSWKGWKRLVWLKTNFLSRYFFNYVGFKFFNFYSIYRKPYFIEYHAKFTTPRYPMMENLRFKLFRVSLPVYLNLCFYVQAWRTILLRYLMPRWFRWIVGEEDRLHEGCLHLRHTGNQGLRTL